MLGQAPVSFDQLLDQFAPILGDEGAALMSEMAIERLAYDLGFGEALRAGALLERPLLLAHDVELFADPVRSGKIVMIVVYIAYTITA